MSRAPTAYDVLRAQPAHCAKCQRAIALVEDRDRCADCRTNYCSSCGLGEEHADHATALLPGFPELSESATEIAARSSKVFASLSGRFPTRDNIYFGKLIWAGRFLERSAASGGTLPKRISPEYAAWFSEHGEPLLRRFVSLKAMGRYVDYFSRRAFAGRLADGFVIEASQGTVAPLEWRGIPMMRTAWDFALLPMIIQEVRPRTVIELGTAAGGGAVYAADLQRLHGIGTNVLTVDRSPPELRSEGVRFLMGDTNRVERALPPELLEGQPHPWLVIEDSHANIGGSLQYMHNFLRKGDYFCIEDIDAEKWLFSFLAVHREYRVDTHFTDFFGHNNTCCPDQIFRRVA